MAAAYAEDVPSNDICTRVNELRSPESLQMIEESDCHLENVQELEERRTRVEESVDQNEEPRIAIA